MSPNCRAQLADLRALDPVPNQMEWCPFHRAARNVGEVRSVAANVGDGQGILK
jgi:hypothetical protein